MNRPFKFADLFPVRKGDLAKLTDDANENWRLWFKEHTEPQDNHSLFEKTLLVLSDPIKGTLDNNDTFVHVFVQEDSEYADVSVSDLQRILVL